MYLEVAGSESPPVLLRRARLNPQHDLSRHIVRIAQSSRGGSMSKDATFENYTKALLFIEWNQSILPLAKFIQRRFTVSKKAAF